jgi:hypothetical protein
LQIKAAIDVDGAETLALDENEACRVGRGARVLQLVHVSAARASARGGARLGSPLLFARAC